MTRPAPLHVAFIAFGSNLGNRRITVERAIRALARLPGATVTAVSDLYETAPVGGPARQRAYLNGVVRLGFAGTPADLFRHLRTIETELGRVRRVQWGPRTLDLDLLAFDRRCLRTPRLTVPHPRYHERAFVLVPFCDVAPGFVHPVLGAQNRTLLRQLTSDPGVTMMGRWKKSRFLPSGKRRKSARPSSR